MNFSTPWRVLQTIRTSDDAEWNRGENRLKINNRANCAPPLTTEMAKKVGLKINVEFGELMQALASARRQYRRAFWGSLYFFNVGLKNAPPQYQQDWQLFITDWINTRMKDSPEYFELSESTFAAVVAHGQGPCLWYDKFSWCPEYVAIEDLRIASDTTCDHKNLEWFGVRKQYTPGELVKKAFAEGSRWDKKQVFQMVKNKKNQNYDFAANNYDWESQPEKFAEMVKQDGGYYLGSAMPTFPLWHFYFLDETPEDESKKGWYMKVVPAEGAQNVHPENFLWEANKPVARHLRHLFHCQYGDLSNKAPFMHHSVRSLGFALMEPTFYRNLTRCRMLQHLHDQFNVWLRSTDPADRARAMIQEFSNYGVVKPGLTIVPQAERHQVEHDLIQIVMADTKQLQQEASTAYTQSTDTGTKREQTAFETSVKMEQVNAMTSGLLQKAFIYEKQKYKEICRRFTLADSDDEDVKEFQEAARAFGIPPIFIDIKQWQVEPVTPLGGGNPTLARAAARELLEILPILDPTAQQEAKHEIVLTITNDPKKASRWAPLNAGRDLSNAKAWAIAIFGTLMQGTQVPMREGLPAQDQFEAMVSLLAAKITLITRRDNMATAEEGMGLQAVIQYLGQLIQQLAQDPREKQNVKQYSDALGKLSNEAKALIQRGVEAKAKSNGGMGGMSPEMAKMQATMMQAQTKVRITEQKAQQSARQKEQSHVREERRKDASAFAEIQRQNELAKSANRMKAFEE